MASRGSLPRAGSSTLTIGPSPLRAPPAPGPRPTPPHTGDRARAHPTAPPPSPRVGTGGCPCLSPGPRKHLPGAPPPPTTRRPPQASPASSSDPAHGPPRTPRGSHAPATPAHGFGPPVCRGEGPTPRHGPAALTCCPQPPPSSASSAARRHRAAPPPLPLPPRPTGNCSRPRRTPRPSRRPIGRPPRRPAFGLLREAARQSLDPTSLRPRVPGVLFTPGLWRPHSFAAAPDWLKRSERRARIGCQTCQLRRWARLCTRA